MCEEQLCRSIVTRMRLFPVPVALAVSNYMRYAYTGDPRLTICDSLGVSKAALEVYCILL
ncbi:hypothetical protein DPMN_163586 [Dreissena polymorpha]|uniref:Uncharacterized protein n=1 Tax=Dreissena polymorpha TaxID=45954 RepID=A0A9D4ISY5_DREPO|nr:hypothetical protein DPMN_163586 [Dreissena polymorpha]